MPPFTAALFQFILIIFVYFSQVFFPPSPKLPSELTFQTRIGNSNTFSIYYVDPTTLEMKFLLSSQEGQMDGFVWSPTGKYIAVVYRTFTRGFRDRICTYTNTGKLIQCFSVDLYGSFSLDFPIFWSHNEVKLSFMRRCTENIPCLSSFDLSNQTITDIQLFTDLSGQTIQKLYWSPSGKYVALFVTSNDTTNQGILQMYKVDDKQAGTVNFKKNYTYEDCLSWSEDESKLAMVQDRVLSTISTSGNFSDPVGRVFKNLDIIGCPLTWSHSGAFIAFLGIDAKGVPGLYLLNIKLANSVKILDNFYPVYHIVWSKDDSAIAVDTISTGEVVIVMNGWEKWYRLYDTSLGNPAWKP